MARQSKNADNLIYKLRKELKLTQEEFADKIGLTKSGISSLESGRRKLTESNFKLICSVFCANENWLRNGEGNMFVEMSIDDEFYKLIANNSSSLNFEQKETVSSLLKLDKRQWELVKLSIDTLTRK